MFCLVLTPEILGGPKMAVATKRQHLLDGLPIEVLRIRSP